MAAGIEIWEGFVLAGGNSRRMGQDKAQLPWRGQPLFRHQAETLQMAGASRVRFIAAADWPAAPDLAPGELVTDLYPGQGPLGGILTALAASSADWVFVLAADMPMLPPGLVLELAAKRGDVDAVVPANPNQKWQPLSAFYHRRSALIIQPLFDAGLRKVVTALESLTLHPVPMPREPFLNANTPEEYAALLQFEAAKHRPNPGPPSP